MPEKWDNSLFSLYDDEEENKAILHLVWKVPMGQKHGGNDGGNYLHSVFAVLHQLRLLGGTRTHDLRIVESLQL